MLQWLLEVGAHQMWRELLQMLLGRQEAMLVIWRRQQRGPLVLQWQLQVGAYRRWRGWLQMLLVIMGWVLRKLRRLVGWQ